MTSRGASLVARLLIFLVLVSSGLYLLVYLYRWEWNRAVIAGIFFLGAEMTLIASMLFTRLRRLHESLNQRVEVRPQPPEAPSADDAPFAWLDPAGGGFGVFVPVLMGAGFLLSGVAFLIEKLSGALSPSDEIRRRSAAPVRPLAVPTQGLVPGPGVSTVTPIPTVARRRRSAWPTLVTLAVAALLTVAAVDLLADATQDRPDPKRAGTTLVDLEIRIREPGPSVSEAADALWGACRARLPASATRVGFTPINPDEYRLVFDGVIGRNARRRFVGCLEDATVDRVQGRVAAVTTQPVRPS